jgi:hypothetical protein
MARGGRDDEGSYEDEGLLPDPLLFTRGADGTHGGANSHDGGADGDGATASTRGGRGGGPRGGATSWGARSRHSRGGQGVTGRVSRWWASTVSPRVSDVLRVVAVGQVISALVCSTGVFSKLLVLKGVSVPCSQSLLTYAMLAAVYLPVLARRGTLRSALRKHWGFFLAAAIADVEANYVIVTAYRYTNFTSVQLLDCTTVVS